MADQELTTEQLLQENEELRLQLANLEKELTTIRKPGNSEIEARFSAVYSAMSDGMALHDIIYNSKGKSIDYIITDVNPSFEKITGLSKNNISGKKATEVYSVDEAPYLEIYSEVAISGNSVSFETFFAPMRKYLKVSVFSPSKGKFATVFQDITERKQVEEVLAFQARLLSEVNDAVFSSDKDFLITYWNKAAEKIFGWTKEEALGQNSGELLKPKIENSSRDKERSRLRSEGHWEGKVQYIRKDGTYFYTEVNSKILKDSAGNDSGNVIVARDITESKKIEAALSESEERYHQMFDKHQAVGLLIDPETGDIIEANSAAVKYYGYSYEQLCSLKIQDINKLPPDEVKAEWEKALTEKRNYFVFQHQLANGESRWVEVYSSPLCSNGRQLLYSIVHDITSRKIAEESLRVSEERFSKAFKNSPNAITITRLNDGKIIDGNESVYSLLGYNHEEVVGKTTMELGIWKNSADRLKLANALSLKGTIYNEEFVLSKKDGTQVPVNLSASVITIDKEQCFICSFIDLTERKKAEEALKKSEGRFRLALKNAPVSVAIQDRNLVYTWAYNQKSRLTEEIIGKTDDDLFAPEDLEWIKPLKNNLLESGKEMNVEKWITTNGQRLYLGIHYEPIFDQSRAIIGIGAATIDLTDHQRAVDAQCESEERLRIALEAAEFGTWDIDPETGITIRSLRHDQIFGYRELQKEWTIEKTEQHILQEDIPIVKKAHSRALLTGVMSFEARVKWPDGSIHWISSLGSANYSKEAKPIRLLGVIADITERKESETVIRESEDRFRTIAETVPVLVCITRLKDSVVLFTNEVNNKAFGLKRNQIIGTTGPDYYFNPDDRVKMFELFKKQGFVNNFELKVKKSDGTPFWIITSIQPVTYNGQEAVIGASIDITESKKTEEALKESESKFSTVFNAAPVAMSLATIPDGKMIDVNQAFLNLVKLKDKRILLGKTSVDAGLIPDPESRLRILKEYQNNGSVSNIEIEANTSDGQKLNLLVNVLKVEIGGTDFLLSTNSDITELKKADRALRLSEERFRNLIKYAPAVIFQMDINGTKFLSVNDTMCNMLGYTRDELALLKPFDLLDELSQKSFSNRVRRRLEGKPIDEDVEFRVKKKNGEWVNTLITVGNISFSTDAEPNITVIAYDITERKKNEAALKESEKKFRELVKFAPSAIYEIDFINKKFLTVNDEMCIMSGYTREELLSLNVLDVFEDESKPLFLSRIKSIKQGEIPDDKIEYKVRSKDGKIMSVLLNMKFYFNEQGAPVGAMCVGHDITQRKQAEEALRESESKFISIFHHSPMPMTLSNMEDGIYHDVNESFMKDSGFSKEEIIGHTSEDLNLWVSLDVRSKIINEVRKRGFVFGATCDFRLKDGRIITCLISLSSLSIKGNLFLLSTIQDITDMVRTKEALQLSELRFRTLAENIPDMIVRFDHNLRMLYGNKAVETRTGQTIEKLMGRTPMQYSAGVVSGRQWEKVAMEVFQTGEPRRIEQANHWQGITQVYDALLVPERDINGSVSSIISIARDITSKKEAENTLKKSEQRLKYHLENSPLAVIEWDNNFKIIQWSNEAERIFGHKKEEAMGVRIDLLNIIYEEDTPIVERTMRRLLSGEELKVVSQNRNYNKDGEVILCVWHNSVLLDENGEMSSVLSLVEDITLLKKTESELFESRESYKELVTNARSMILKFDNDANFTFVNDYAVEFFGYEKEELLGKSVMIVVPKKESSGRDLDKMVEDIIGDPDKYSINVNENIKKNGEKVWVEWHNKTLYDNSGKKAGHIAIGLDITKRKKAEEALKETEEKLWSVLNATQESIYMFDRDGIVKMANATGLKRFKNIASGNFLGKHFSEFLTPSTARLRKEKMDEVFKTGKPVVYEDERDGRFFNHNFFPVFKDTEVSSIVSYSTDITIRKKAEETLKESEDRLRTIAESLTVMISITRISDATTSFVNEPYLNAYGFTRDEIIGKPDPAIFVFPKDRDIIHDLLRESDYVYNREIKVRKKDGTQFWILTSIRKINYMGEPSFLASSNDITETKNAQEELIRLNRTLNANSKSSQAMMHTDNEFNYLNEVCKIIIDDCGHSMVWIGYAENDKKKSVKPVAFYGFDQGYIDQMDITWDNSPNGNGPTGRAIKTCKPSVCRNMLSDNSFKPWRDAAISRGFSSSLVLPLMSEGKSFGAISIYSKEPDAFSKSEIELLSDLADDLGHGISFIRLTESERTAARVIKENESKLKEMIITKDKFFNIIAHDLKNPFTSLLGSSELLYDNLDQMTTENVKQLALILNDSAKGGYAILQNLLDWSRSQTGMIKYCPTQINLKSLIEENIENFNLQTANKKIDMHSNLKDDLIILADRNMIDTVLRNLLSNSVKFTHKNGKVAVSIIKLPNEIIMSVKDTGVGINKEKIEKLFTIENSLSMPGTEKEQGTGLGLKLCKEFTERMGGRIWVESAEGKGCEFNFTIPINGTKA
jgi:PAS domain S-box-containing protein